MREPGEDDELDEDDDINVTAFKVVQESVAEPQDPANGDASTD